MSSSGVRHFTEKAQLLFRTYNSVLLQDEERNEIAHRMAVPFKNNKSTKFVTKELAHIKRVHEAELRKQQFYAKAEKASDSDLESSSNQTTKAPVSGEQTANNKRKRSPTDDGAVSKAKMQKTSPGPCTLESRDSPNFAIERLEQVIKLTEKINAVSKRYNGPDGKVIPPIDYKLSLQERALSNFLAVAKKSSRPEHKSLDLHIKMYGDKLCNKIRDVIMSWNKPSTGTTPRLHGDAPKPRKYGQKKEDALAFVVRTFWDYPAALLEMPYLYEQIPKAEDQDLEALATTIESWEKSIINEIKKSTFTQKELALQRPQTRIAESLLRNQRHEQKDHTWEDWIKAKTASKLAEEAEKAKSGITNLVKESIAKHGDHLLPHGTTPLNALPIHMRRRMRKFSGKKGDQDYFMGDVVPAGAFSLGIYAKTMGRSKLSNIVAGVGSGSDCQKHRQHLRTFKIWTSTARESKIIKQKPILWNPET
ncbi:hypothetical protein DL95DRAFT_466616 [Leptodontidium sp. 2 PMI_412]|nr:hypothetical protein DL95DRAFT_466616 [Leptodontidium sp. 2 PMI_412]